MIFYFTGTGNSLQVAKNIGKYHGENIFSIPALMHEERDQYEYTLKDKEKIGFVFPIYASDAPKMVHDFIKKLKITNLKDNYVFAVGTCGASVSDTMRVIESNLKKRNIILNSGFSVVMPNNYMIMGMDVDSEREFNEKLSKIDGILENINKVIEKEEKSVFQLEKGTMPALMTVVGSALFNKFMVNTKKFYAKDNCTSCGICEKVCNTKTIKVEGKPIWGKKCTQCLACINLCPVRSIEYGSGTINKGRYRNPNISINELGF